MPSDSVTAALVSAIAVLFGGYMAFRGKMAETRDNREAKENEKIAAGMAAQISGWDDLSRNMQNRIVGLEAENERCNKRVAEISQRLADSETKADALQDSVIELRRQVEQLRYEADQRSKQRIAREKPS